MEYDERKMKCDQRDLPLPPFLLVQNGKSSGSIFQKTM